MSGLLGGPHDLANKALRAREATPAVANTAGANAKVIVALTHDLLALALQTPMALDALVSPSFPEKRWLGLSGRLLNLNSTNHMRAAEGGAFPLPSVGRL
jgi:hypothetical protein